MSDLAFRTQRALSDGHSEDDIRNRLAGKFNDEEINSSFELASRIQIAFDDGHTEEAVRTRLNVPKPVSDLPEISVRPPTEPSVSELPEADLEPVLREPQLEQQGDTPAQLDPVQAALPEKQPIPAPQFQPGILGGTTPPRDREQDRVSDFVAVAQNFTRNPEQGFNLVASFVSDNYANDYDKAEEDSRKGVMEIAKKQGIELRINEDNWEVFTANKEWVDVTPDLIQSLSSMKGELLGGIVGSLGGAVTGAEIGSAIGSVIPIPGATAVGAVIGATTFGLLGTVLGSETDLLLNSIELQEEISLQRIHEKAIGSAKESIVFDAIGLGVFASVKQGANIVKEIQGLINRNISNTARATRSLQDNFLINEDQAKEIVTTYENITKSTAPGATDAEKALSIIPTTQPGGERLLNASLSPEIKAAVVKDVSARAVDVKNLVNKFTGDSPGRDVLDALDTYTGQVKSYYTSVKERALRADKTGNFQFSFDDLGIKDVVKGIVSRIGDRKIQKNVLVKLKALSKSSEDRSFESLLEVRYALNDIKFNGRITKVKDKELIQGLLDNVDKEIGKGAKILLEDGDKWIRDFKDANFQYFKMKELDSNSLARLLLKGTTEKGAVSAFDKIISKMTTTNSVGGFEQIMSKLPAQTRIKAENAIIANLMESSKIFRRDAESQAINFPELANKLADYPFKSKEAKHSAEVINRLSTLFKNDFNLSKLNGNLNVAGSESAFQNDLLGKAKLTLLNRTWRKLQSFAPSAQGRRLVLINKVEKLLENPMNSALSKELAKEIPDILPLIQQLQQTAAKKEYTNTRVKIAPVRGSSTFKIDKLGKENIPLHRIANEKEVKRILNESDLEFTNLTELSKEAKEILKSNDYLGHSIGEEIVVY